MAIAGVQINIFPYAADSIDFDFDTAELRTQTDVDALADLIEVLSRSVGRDVVMSYEGANTAEFLVFDIALDEFTFLDQEPKTIGPRLERIAPG